MNVAEKLIAARLLEGDMRPGEPIALAVDQTLTQDATGTLVMLALESMGIESVETPVSVQYVDHNLLQTDQKNADDHVFLASACRKFGIVYSPPGNGVSHPLHMDYFGVPGRVLIGSDSHTCAGGALGMLAIGVGGVEVAAAMAGGPLRLRMPEVLGVELVGELPEWVSAKDIVLEMLRRRGVSGAAGKVIEYHGPGLAGLSIMDRHVIANMGTELGATTTVFPADAAVREFLRSRQREDGFEEITADENAAYARSERIDLAALEPLIARPSSPGNVVPVRDVAGKPVRQCYIGSSANPGLRDFAVPAFVLKGSTINPEVSLEINPTSRDIVGNLSDLGLLLPLLRAGARLHQAGCNGCIGMGQAPSTGGISLRTVPRNFAGRSGSADDQVYLCSPETAVAAALTGCITDPRDLGMPYPRYAEPAELRHDALFVPPAEGDTSELPLAKGPHIGSLPEFDRLPEHLDGPILLKLGDDVSTDDILPGGAEILPYRSNIEAISRYLFERIDESYADRAAEQESSFLVAGRNYGQGSSREHAAAAPRFLGLRGVIAKGFARIHRQNLINFGVLPLMFVEADDYERFDVGDGLRIDDLRQALTGAKLSATKTNSEETFELTHDLDARDIDTIRAGGLLNVLRGAAATDSERRMRAD